MSFIIHLIGLLIESSVFSFVQANHAPLTLLYNLDGNVAFDAYLTEEATLQMVTLSDRYSSIANVRIIEMNERGHIVEDKEFICSSLNGDSNDKKRLFHNEPLWLSQECFTLSVFTKDETHWNPTCYFFSSRTGTCLKRLHGVSVNSALATLSPLQRFFSINVKQNHFALLVSEKDVSSSKSTEDGKFIFVSPEEIRAPREISQTRRGAILNANHQLQPPPSIPNVTQSLSTFQWDELCGVFFPDHILTRAGQGQWRVHSVLTDSDKWRLRLASPLRFNRHRLHCTLLYQHKKESFRLLALYVEVHKKDADLEIDIVQSKPFIMIGGCVSAYYFPAMQHFILGGSHCGASGIYGLRANDESCEKISPSELQLYDVMALCWEIFTQPLGDRTLEDRQGK